MNDSQREQIILNYINAYNLFDVDRMVKDFDEAILFENVRNKIRTDSLQGLEAFKEQAIEAKNYFSQRTQTILKMAHFEQNSIIDITYHAVLAIDFSDDLKAGYVVELQGQSIFEFTEAFKIKKLIDLS
ncbi:hypothetical protein ACFRAE_10660 [Sphingobacterium sp. HJSM2_6]|uniref:hypothetical protein n=1 Tax=Sphingobacterium sp. HJSM2_6 TaxID=3366264 RepID=UPI003BBB23BC